MMKHLAGWTAAAMTVVLTLATSAHAGRVPIPGDDTAAVAPGDTAVYTERFFGEEPALVRVTGDGESRLEVDVYDNAGNLIDSDVGYSCTVSWTPAWTGKFRVKVINLGDEVNLFHLRTN